MHRFYLYFLSIHFIFAVNFEFNHQNPTIIIDGQELSNGFLGGLNYSITRWVDWDNDNDSDSEKASKNNSDEIKRQNNFKISEIKAKEKFILSIKT